MYVTLTQKGTAMNREQIKARLNRPLHWVDYLTGVLTGILLVVGILVIAKSDRADAATVGIRCQTANVTTVQNTARVTIKSNKRIVYGQTSVKFSYFDRNMRQQWVTMDSGYGAVIFVKRPAGAREWGLFKTWHAGTRCRDYAVGGAAGSVNN